MYLKFIHDKNRAYYITQNEVYMGNAS